MCRPRFFACLCKPPLVWPSSQREAGLPAGSGGRCFVLAVGASGRWAIDLRPTAGRQPACAGPRSPGPVAGNRRGQTSGHRPCEEQEMTIPVPAKTATRRTRPIHRRCHPVSQTQRVMPRVRWSISLPRHFPRSQSDSSNRRPCGCPSGSRASVLAPSFLFVLEPLLARSGGLFA